MSTSVTSNVLWKFAERVLAQAVSLIVSIVLARILLPDDYGAVAMVTVFITIANAFVTDGIPTALIQKKNADEMDFSSVFWFNILMSICLYAILFFTAPLIGNFYHMKILDPVIKVMGLKIIVAGINSVQHAYVSRHMMFRKYFWSTLFGTVLSGVIGIWMAYNNCGVWALVAQYMINTVVDTVVLFVTVNWRPRIMFSIKRVIQLVGFGWKILFESLSNTLFGQINNLIIGRVYTSSDLGYYTKSQQFPSGFVSSISAAIASVLLPAMANEQDDIERVKNLLRKSVRVSTYVVLPLLVGLGVTAKPFVCFLLTEKWVDCVPYLQIFCFTNALTIGMIPRHQALNGIGRSDVYMIEHIFARIVGLILLLAVFKISVMAIAISGIASTVILTFTVMYTSKRYNNYKYKEQIMDVVPSIIGCTIMGVPVYFVQFIGLSYFKTLIIQIVLGIIIYVIYSSIRKLEEFIFIRQYVERLIKHS